MLNAPALADPSSTIEAEADSGAAGHVRTCTYCGDAFDAPAKGPGQHKRFCDSVCRTAFANREKAQGSVLVTIAKVWRKTRGSGDLGAAAFREMTSILDCLNAEDARLDKGLGGRLETYVGKLLAEGRYFDRMDRNRLGKDGAKRKQAARSKA